MWSFKIEVPGHDVVELSSDDLTAGEDASIYALVATRVVHDERFISPAHCPVCRSAIAVVALISRGRIPDGDASAIVSETPRVELLGCFSFQEL